MNNTGTKTIELRQQAMEWLVELLMLMLLFFVVFVVAAAANVVVAAAVTAVAATVAAFLVVSPAPELRHVSLWGYVCGTCTSLSCFSLVV